jgi:hypothetical protein
LIGKSGDRCANFLGDVGEHESINEIEIHLFGDHAPKIRTAGAESSFNRDNSQFDLR